MRKVIIILILFINLFANTNEQKIKQINFIGLESISSKVALETLDLKAKDLLDENKIDKAIKSYYDYGYFQDIYVDFNDGILTFHFKEKPIISTILIKGYKTRDDEIKALLMGMGIKKGSMYTKQKIKNAKKFLLRQLDMEGYVGSVVETEIEHINDSSLKVTFFVNKGYELIATKVNYFGAKKLTQDDFENVTANKEHEFMGWFIGRNDGQVHLEQLEYDARRIQDLYYQNGYLDAKVSSPLLIVDFNTFNSTLDFHIKEGKQYIVSNINIDVDDKLVNITKFKDNMFLTKNKKFNSAYLRKDIKALKLIVANKGYAYARVLDDIKKDGNNSVTVSLHVLPGKKVYINDVKISGNTKTLDRVIRRNIYLASGDLYNQTDYQDSIHNLKRTGYFSNVSITKKRVSDNKMDLIVKVQETTTGSVMLGGGYGSYDGLMLNASVNDKNIFGSGKNLGLQFERSSKRKTYKLYLRNPALNDSTYSASIDIHKYHSETTNTDDDGISNTSYLDTKGIGLGFGKKISRNIYAGINIANDTETLTDDSNSTDIDEYTDYVVRSVTPSLVFNNTDDYYTPRRGHNLSLSYKIAGFGGDAKYTKTFIKYKYFFGLEKYIDYDLILRYKMSIGILNDRGNIRYTDSFYLGGPKSVRGYQYSAFGPTSSDDVIYDRLMTNSIEASIPILSQSKMRLSFFYDEGRIGRGGFDLTKRGRGITIEWFTPMGPLQFIFARAINPDINDDTSNFEFTIGQTF